MSDVPEFVQLVRQIVPKEGIMTDKPSRIKNKIKKALTKAGYETETLRGIGRKVGDYAIVYEEKDGVFYANFTSANQVPQKVASGKRSRSSRKVKQDLFLGVNEVISHLSIEEFTKETLKLLPEKWQNQPVSAYKWVSTDINFLMNNLYTPETAAEYLVLLAGTHLSPELPCINFTTMEIHGNYIIGVGPA